MGSLQELGKFRWLLLLACVLVVDTLWGSNIALAATDAAHAEAGHESPVTPLLLSLVIVMLAAKIGGDLAIRLRQPEVLGELVMGVFVGNLVLFGYDGLDYLKTDRSIGILSELGVILLLFEVGLESSVGEMMRVGFSSLVVAVLGVIAPFFLGWGVAAWFAPEAGTLVHVFVGATLTATSVGITARVLKDLGKIQSQEAKIILGAAVIDDVLGLLVLAVVSAIITATAKGTEMEALQFITILASAFGFLIGAIVLGRIISPLSFRLATYLRSHGLLLATALSICFGLSYLAAMVGLAPIVGAFTAGLILEPVHYRDYERFQDQRTIEQLIAPIASLLVPIFFVIMGARVDLTVFANASILQFAFWLTLAAIIGKQVCGLGIFNKGVDRIAVGLGMIPRGEVGLIFAGIGATLMLDGEPVVNAATYGAVVIMVIVTTMVTPPLLSWRMKKPRVLAELQSSNEEIEETPTRANGTQSAR